MWIRRVHCMCAHLRVVAEQQARPQRVAAVHHGGRGGRRGLQRGVALQRREGALVVRAQRVQRSHLACERDRGSMQGSGVSMSSILFGCCDVCRQHSRLAKAGLEFAG